MRSTRPMTKWSSIRSPTMSTARPRARSSSVGRSAGAAGMDDGRGGDAWGALRRVGQRHEDEEQHQELGVAEVVFEQSGREHRRDYGDAGVRERRKRLTAAPEE